MGLFDIIGTSFVAVLLIATIIMFIFAIILLFIEVRDELDKRKQPTFRKKIAETLDTRYRKELKTWQPKSNSAQPRCGKKSRS